MELGAGWLSLTTLWFLLQLTARCGGREGVKGREFYVAVPQFSPEGFEPAQYSMTLTLVNLENREARVKFEYYPDLAQTEVRVAPLESLSHVLPADFNLVGALEHARAVRVTSDKDSMLQLNTFYDVTPNASSAGFTVLPRDSLTEDYVVATHCVTGNCVLLVTSVEDNGGGDGDSVVFTLRLRPNTTEAQFEGNLYGDGDTFKKADLDKGQSFQVLCSECDMTGTLVASRRDVAVFAGGELTKFQDGNLHQDMVLEQMMPIETIGRQYVVATPLPSPSSHLIKVVPLTAGTRFSLKGTCYSSSVDRDVFYFHLHGNETQEILADHKTLVLEVTAGQDDAAPDVSMTLPVPRYQWVQEYTAYTPEVGPNDPTQEVVLSLIHSAQVAAELAEVDPSVDVTVSLVVNETGSSYAVAGLHTTASGTRTVTCSNRDCGPFTGFILHSGAERTASFTLRNKIEDFKTNAAHSREVTAACAEDETTTMEVTTETTTMDVTTETTTMEVTTETTTIDVTTETTTMDVTTETTPTDTTPQSTSDSSTQSSSETTSDATSSATTTDVIPTTSEKSCCPCPNISVVDVDLVKAKLLADEENEENLLLDRKKLSSYIRTKETAQDKRVSSAALGTSLGVTIFTVVFAVLIIPDMLCIAQFFFRLARQFHKPGINDVVALKMAESPDPENPDADTPDADKPKAETPDADIDSELGDDIDLLPNMPGCSGAS